MIYKVAFTGRKANANGIFYPMFVTIEATDHDDFIDRFIVNMRRGRTAIHTAMKC